MRCDSCGNAVKNTEKFCRHCGQGHTYFRQNKSEGNDQVQAADKFPGFFLKHPGVAYILIILVFLLSGGLIYQHIRAARNDMEIQHTFFIFNKEIEKSIKFVHEKSRMIIGDFYYHQSHGLSDIEPQFSYVLSVYDKTNELIVHISNLIAEADNINSIRQSEEYWLHDGNLSEQIGGYGTRSHDLREKLIVFQSETLSLIRDYH